MDVLVTIDMAGCPSECALERVQLAVQFRIDLILIQPSGEGSPHQHGERWQSVPWRRAGHRTQRPVIGQCQVKADIDLIRIGLQPGSMVRPERRHRHATGGRQPAPVDQVADGGTDAGRKAVVVRAQYEWRRSGAWRSVHSLGVRFVISRAIEAKPKGDCKCCEPPANFQSVHPPAYSIAAAWASEPGFRRGLRRRRSIGTASRATNIISLKSSR